MQGHKNHILRIVCYYLWAWLAMGYVVFSYISSSYHTRQLETLTNQHDVQSMRTWKTLRYYPVSLLVSLAPGTINRTLEAVHKTKFIFRCLHSATSSLMGAFNATIFFLNPKVQNQMRRMMRRSLNLHWFSSTLNKGLLKAEITSQDDVEVIDFELEGKNENKQEPSLKLQNMFIEVDAPNPMTFTSSYLPREEGHHLRSESITSLSTATPQTNSATRPVAYHFRRANTTACALPLRRETEIANDDEN
mmetsp:Transcript_6223/g.15001  ORF Transcript_6223/g.15001 Transcript_6223/m.15001 type:complete len:248 (+) Transcript_6223:615-1358(+)